MSPTLSGLIDGIPEEAVLGIDLFHGNGVWLAVPLVCVVSTWLGYLAASVTRGPFEGLVDGFAAGALLVMLVGR